MGISHQYPFSLMTAPLQPFPSFCTVCDVQLDSSSFSQIYCSEKCKLKDCECSGSIPSHWYDSFNNIQIEQELGLVGDLDDITSPTTSTRDSILSLRDSSSRGSISSYSSTTIPNKRSSTYSSLLPWYENADQGDILPSSLPTRRLTQPSCTASPLSDMFCFEKHTDDFESSLNALQHHIDTQYEPIAITSRPRRHSLYIKSGLHLYTGTSSRRTSLDSSYATTTPFDISHPESPRSIGLVLPPPPPTKKQAHTFEYEVPRLKSVSSPVENQSEKQLIY